ncbi:MAG: molybdopterin molybdenumtransferase MoeA, partial [Aeromicrobium sp.]|nr:molybdopterin molybdenumtransferase MoeA [Aeromicrobium sp.]
RVVNGAPSAVVLTRGEALGIGTGGAVPAGTTGIVRREHGQVDAAVLGLLAGHSCPRNDVRPQGEEARRGEVVVRSGTRLDGMTVAVAASAGHDELEVVAVPRVDVLITGDEIVQRGRPAAGQVRDSVTPALTGMVRGAGARLASSAAVPDAVDRIAAHLQASTADIVLTTGGTAVGEADHLRDALALVGADVVIDRVSVRPGGPTVLAVLPDGRLVAGLPGNPLAAVVGFLAVVEPALRAMTGHRAPAGVPVTLGADIGVQDSGTRLVPYVRSDEGAVPSPWTSSSMLRGLASSDGLLVVPAGRGALGDIVEALAPSWITS